MSYTSMMRDKNRVTKKRKAKPSPTAKPAPDMADFDDELLVILLRNLRNAAVTFGEGTPPHENIRKVVDDHLNDMKRKGKATNIVRTRQKLRQSEDRGTVPNEAANQARDAAAETVSHPMANLTIRAKPAAP